MKDVQLLGDGTVAAAAAEVRAAKDVWSDMLLLVRSDGDLAPVITGDVREDEEEDDEEEEEVAAPVVARWVGDVVDDDGDWSDRSLRLNLARRFWNHTCAYWIIMNYLNLHFGYFQTQKKKAGRNCFRFCFFFFMSFHLFVCPSTPMAPVASHSKYIGQVNGSNWRRQLMGACQPTTTTMRQRKRKERKKRANWTRTSQKERSWKGGRFRMEPDGRNVVVCRKKNYIVPLLYIHWRARQFHPTWKKKESNNKKRKAGHTNLLVPLQKKKNVSTKSPASLPCWLYGAGSARLPNF